MAKRGRPRSGTVPLRVKERRVWLYVMPEQRSRLNWLASRLSVDNQSDALAAALDAIGVPPEVSADEVQP